MSVVLCACVRGVCVCWVVALCGCELLTCVCVHVLLSSCVCVRGVVGVYVCCRLLMCGWWWCVMCVSVVLCVGVLCYVVWRHNTVVVARSVVWWWRVGCGVAVCGALSSACVRLWGVVVSACKCALLGLGDARPGCQPVCVGGVVCVMSWGWELSGWRDGLLEGMHIVVCVSLGWLSCCVVWLHS